MPGPSNYPSGFPTGLFVRGMPLLQAQPGNVFWVDNSAVISNDPIRAVSGSDNNRGTFQRPFATIYGALLHCQHGNGDIIFVRPGHQETVTGAGVTSAVSANGVTVSVGTSLFFDVAGVSIIGLGSGLLRPQINFTTATTANIPVRAAGMSMQNVLCVNNFADIASNFTAIAASSVTSTIAANVLTAGTVTGTLYPGVAVMGTGVTPGTIILNQLTGTTGAAGTYTVNISQTVSSATFTYGAHDFNLEQNEFRDTSSVLNALTVFTGAATVANNANGFRFVNNRVSSLGTTAATTAIKLQTATARCVITDNFGCWAVLNDTAAILAAGANNMTDFEFARNHLERPNTSSTGGSFISTSATAWTGHAYDNYMYQLDNSAGIWIATSTGGAFGFSNNFSPITGAVDKSALINPAAV